MDWFLYDNGPRHERVKSEKKRGYKKYEGKYNKILN